MTEAEFRALAMEHAPLTSKEIEQAAKSLAADGHSDHGIAHILQANLNSVRQLIGERK